VGLVYKSVTAVPIFNIETTFTALKESPPISKKLSSMRQTAAPERGHTLAISSSMIFRGDTLPQARYLHRLRQPGLIDFSLLLRGIRSILIKKDGIIYCGSRFNSVAFSLSRGISLSAT
jgi:hypothetical protein